MVTKSATCISQSYPIMLTGGQLDVICVQLVGIAFDFVLISGSVYWLFLWKVRHIRQQIQMTLLLKTSSSSRAASKTSFLSGLIPKTVMLTKWSIILRTSTRISPLVTLAPPPAHRQMEQRLWIAIALVLLQRCAPQDKLVIHLLDAQTLIAELSPALEIDQPLLRCSLVTGDVGVSVWQGREKLRDWIIPAFLAFPALNGPGFSKILLVLYCVFWNTGRRFSYFQMYPKAEINMQLEARRVLNFTISKLPLAC